MDDNYEKILNMPFEEFIQRLENNTLPNFPRKPRPYLFRETTGICWDKKQWLYNNRQRLQYMNTDDFIKSASHVDIIFCNTAETNTDKLWDDMVALAINYHKEEDTNAG